MATYLAVYDEAGGDDRAVEATAGKPLRVQRDLEGARHLEAVDIGGTDTQPLDLRQERSR